MGDFNLKRCKVKMDVTNERVGMYLCQIRNDHSETSAKKWGRIKKILLDISYEKNPCQFVVFPEISLPSKYVVEARKIIKRNYKANTAFIFGVETITADECMRLVKAIGPEDKSYIDILLAASPDTLVNPCIIIVRDNVGCSSYVQLKITPSKFETSHILDNNTVQSNYIYIIEGTGIRFCVAICSDFINRIPGSHRRIVDVLDLEVLKEGESVDFLFNIQHNPAPDSHLFYHSLERLYDDGYNSHGTLCTVFVNSILTGDRFGGNSKVLFHKSSKITPLELIKQVDAPVVGYELDQDEQVLYMVFDRLRKSWDPVTDFSPIKFSMYGLHNGYIIKDDKRPMSYVCPMEKKPTIDIATYNEVASRLSKIGEHEKSIEFSQHEFKRCKNNKDSLGAAIAALSIAIQYRHSGKLNESVKYYNVSEYEARCITERSASVMLIMWRIKAGRVMTEMFMLKNKCPACICEYMEIVNEIENYLAVNPSTKVNKSIMLYKVHANRQIAEMRRIMGQYNESLAIFAEAFEAYGYQFPEEKAYCLLGQGESLRMLHRYEEALDTFQKVLDYAEHMNARKLLSRVNRNLATITALMNKSENTYLHQLQQNLQGTSLYERVYAYLVLGETWIANDVTTAEVNFDAAFEESKSFAAGFRLEQAHALFGKGECCRMTGRLGEAALYYNESLAVYKEGEVQWGVIRVTVALNSIDSTSINVGDAPIKVFNGLDQDLKNTDITDMSRMVFFANLL